MVHELAEQRLEQLGAPWVQAHHRLIDHDYLGPVHQGAGDDHLLPHAVAVRFGQFVAPGGQLEQLEQFVDAALHGLPLLTIEGGHEAEELRTGQLVVDKRPVGDKPQYGFGGHRVGVDVLSAHSNDARGGPEDAGDHSQSGGLPGSVGAEKPEQFPCLDGEIDAVDGSERAVAFGDPVQSNHGASSMLIMRGRNRPMSSGRLPSSARFPTVSRMCDPSARPSVGSTGAHLVSHTSAHAL